MSMIKDADEPTDRFECVFVKWDVSYDFTQGVFVTPRTAFKRAIYKFEKWLILIKILNKFICNQTYNIMCFIYSNNAEA